MKSRIPFAVAAIFAAGSVHLALAQDQNAPYDPATDAPTVPFAPAWIPKTDPAQTQTFEGGRNLTPGAAPTYVAEPAASVSSDAGEDGQIAASIAMDINADASMKGAKITVQPDASDHKIYLSGNAMSRQQVQRAYEIATAHAGGVSMVVNAIQDVQT